MFDDQKRPQSRHQTPDDEPFEYPIVGDRRRCMSMPNIFDLASIMKTRTLDESLHKKMKQNKRRRRAGLKFGEVSIREYARIVGDNPSCSSGPPLSISWEFVESRVARVDEYERKRAPRRSQSELALPKHVRMAMLRKDWKIPQKQIAESVRQTIAIKNQRKATVNNLGAASKMEEFLESASRKIMRVLLFRKPLNREVKILEAKMNEAHRIRVKHYMQRRMNDEQAEGMVAVLNGADTNGSGEEVLH